LTGHKVASSVIIASVPLSFSVGPKPSFPFEFGEGHSSSQPGQIVCKTLCQKTPITKKGWWSGWRSVCWKQTPVPQKEKKRERYHCTLIIRIIYKIPIMKNVKTARHTTQLLVRKLKKCILHILLVKK
jgi:hypothetical protein